MNLTDEELDQVAQEVYHRVSNQSEVRVSDLHELVIAVLAFFHHKTVAQAYAEYRYYKTNYAHTFEQLRQDADGVLVVKKR